MFLMDFTYSGNPNASKLDNIRFLIQDTDASDPLLSDSELCYLIENFSSVEKAAIEACYILVAKFSRFVDETEGKQSIKASQLQLNYKTLASELENKISKVPRIFCGGVSANNYTSNKNNPNNVKPQFNDQNGDNPRAWRGNDN